MTILVTGARGTVARAVLDALAAAGETVRVASREPADGTAVVPFDPARPDTVKAALDGVDRVFTYAAHEGMETVAEAAAAAGVRRIVLLSSLAAGMPDNPIGARHLAAEEPLRASGLPLTVLRPGAFATNTLAWARSIREEGVVRIAFPEAHVNSIHEKDMADVAVAALTGEGHEGAVYPLTGPESLSQRRQVELIAEALGRDLTVEELTYEQAATVMFRPVLDMLAAQADGPVPVGPVSADVTGVPSRTYAQWARDHAADFG